MGLSAHPPGGRRRRPFSTPRARARCALAACLALVAISFSLPSLPGHAFSAAPAAEEAPPAAGRPSGATELARKFGTGYSGVVAIAVSECLMLLCCFPGYSSCEYAAGAMFGAPIGVAACCCAKITAATISFVTIRLLRDSPAGRWAQERVTGSGQTSGGFMGRLKAGIDGNSFRFCLMVRCSPLPAWLSNYALPMSGLPFSIYMPASLIGMVPPIATNVYAGAAAASVASVISGGEGTGFGAMGLLALGISVLSSTMLVHQMATTALVEEGSTPGQPSAGSPNPSSTVQLA